MGLKRWKLPEIDAALPVRLSSETGLPEVVCAVLCARGLCDRRAVAEFLDTEAELSSPYTLIDMDKACARISCAIEQDEKIAVYGDYDCDGITATALLTSYLQSVGSNVIYYIPDREKEGYGLNLAAVDLLYNLGISLIVTVDNGISAHREIEYSNSLGIDVVVTDHHTPRDTLPDAVAIVNPHRDDCPSLFKGLAGVGVAFKLVCALEGVDTPELLEYYSDLVAIGTIADVMPLTGENRVIVRHGTARISESGRPGVTALLELAGIAGKTLTGESLAFGLVPRINASGRIGSADDAVELLITDDVPYAMELAHGLDEQNSARKSIEDGILREVEEILQKNPAILDERLLLVSGNSWHHGVVGIVASRLMERYGKPCILFSVSDGIARGSGRSIEGFSLIEAISACSEKLIKYGGHTLAAGLSLPEDALPCFCRQMQAFAASVCEIMPVPVLTVDCILPIERITIADIKPLSMLEPFGAENKQPLFLLRALVIEGIYPTSDKKHLRLKIINGSTSFYAVYFRMTREEFPYRIGDTVDIAAGVSVSEWNDSEQLSIRVQDIRRTGLIEEELLLARECYWRHKRGEYGGICEKRELIPSREETATVYKHLRKYESYPCDSQALFMELDGAVSYARMLIILDVLEETGLLTRDGSAMRLTRDPPKIDLETSRILTSLKSAEKEE